MKIKTSWVVAMALVASLASVQAADVPAKVLKVDGQATVNIPGKGDQALVPGTLIPAGSKIKTAEGATVMVGLTPGAGTIVEENTELEIEKLSVEKKGEKLTKREVQLKLVNDDASTVSFLKSFDGVSDFKIKTTTGIAAARGTIWRTTQATVQVVSGNVQVLIAGLVVDVPAGSAFTNGEGVTVLSQAAVDAIVAAARAAGVPVSAPSGGPITLGLGPEADVIDPDPPSPDI